MLQRWLALLFILLVVSLFGCRDAYAEATNAPWLDESWVVLKPNINVSLAIRSTFHLPLDKSKFALKPEPISAPRIVRLIYFLPKDRQYRPVVADSFRNTVRTAQTFYADQMEQNGYGRLTFNVEKDVRGEFIVHKVLAAYPDEHYQICAFDSIKRDISQAFDIDTNIYLIVIDNKSSMLSCKDDTWGGWGQRRGKTAGVALVHEQADWKVIAHELGHTFGLKHNFKNNTAIMSYGDVRLNLTPLYAAVLSVHPYFNSSVTTEWVPPSIAPEPVQYASMRRISIPFKASSDTGLYLMMLYVKTMEPHPAAGSYELKKSFSWKTPLSKDMVLFEFDGRIPSSPKSRFLDVIKHPVLIELIDAAGNTSHAEVDIPPRMIFTSPR